MQLSRNRWWGWLTAMLVAVACGALLWGGGTLYFGTAISDLTYCFYPWRVFQCRWTQQGVMPWWDPHVFGGYPVLEMQQMAVFNPLTMATVFLLPPRLGLLATMAVHVALTGLCAWVGLRRGLRVSPMAASAGTAVLVFGAVFATRVTAAHFTVIAAWGVAPLGVAGVFRAVELVRRGLPVGDEVKLKSVHGDAEGAKTEGERIQGGGGASVPAPVDIGGTSLRLSVSVVRSLRIALAGECARWVALVAMVNAFSVLAGAPQYVVYLIYAQFIAAVAASAWRRWMAGAVVFGIVWSLAALVSAPQWLPTMSYLPFSARSSVSSSYIGSIVGGEGGSLLAEALLPFPLGDDVTVPHMNKKNVWETAGYPGVAALALGAALAASLVSARSLRNRRVVLAAAIMGLGLFLTTGGWLPGMSGFREPPKARAVIALGLAFAVALQLDRVVAGSRKRAGIRTTRNCAAAGSVSTIAAALCGLGLLAAWRISRDPAGFGEWALVYFGQPFDLIAAVAWEEIRRSPEVLARRFIASTLAASALAFGVAVFAAAAVTGRKWAVAALALVCIGDPFAHHIHLFLSRHRFDYAEIPQPFIEYIAPRIEASRAAGDPQWRVAVHNMLSNYAHHLDGLYEVSGYDPIMPWGANNRQVLHKPKDQPLDRAYALLVAQSLGKRYDLSLWNVHTGEPATPQNTLELNRTAGVASLTRSVRAGSPSIEAFGPDVDGWSFVVPPDHAAKEVDAQSLDAEFRKAVEQVRPLAGDPDTTGVDRFVTADSASIRMEPQRSPNQYDFTVEAQGPSLFLFHMTYLPGWRVSVDGAPYARPWCANHWMPAVAIDGGKRRVSFRYRPENLQPGRGMALVGLVSVAGLLVSARRRRQPAGSR